jgi:hypothetical protein
LIRTHINAKITPKYMLNFKQPSKDSEPASDLNFLATSKITRVIVMNITTPICELKISRKDIEGELR